MIVDYQRVRMRYAIAVAILTQVDASRNRSADSKGRLIFTSSMNQSDIAKQESYLLSVTECVDVVMLAFHPRKQLRGPQLIRLFESEDIGANIRERCVLWAANEHSPALFLDVYRMEAFAHDGERLLRVIGGPARCLSSGVALARKRLMRLAAELPEDLIGQHDRNHEFEGWGDSPF